tara:strand:+ start:2185 stop:2586 length:402 start_codon:yes stop_codon:yes gene_type:complete
MAQFTDLSGGLAFFAGLFALALGFAELRVRGFYLELLSEWEHAPGLRFLTGVVFVLVGAAIYLANPWQVGDPLAMVVTALGGAIVAAGLAFVAVGERMMALARRLVGVRGRGWAYALVACGVLLVAATYARLI